MCLVFMEHMNLMARCRRIIISSTKWGAGDLNGFLCEQKAGDSGGSVSLSQLSPFPAQPSRSVAWE